MVSFKLSSGEVLTSSLHQEWQGAAGRQLVGRTVDLESAYRQVARHPADAAFSVVCTKRPDTGELLFWETPALVFGATGSVYAFNRVSRAILKILNYRFAIVASSYYADCSVIEAGVLAESICWPLFFIISTVLAAPSLLMLQWLPRQGDALYAAAAAQCQASPPDVSPQGSTDPVARTVPAVFGKGTRAGTWPGM